MKQATHFQLQVGWKILLADMGLQPAEVLTLAGLPVDLFNRTGVTLSAQDYFDVLLAMETLVSSEKLPLLLGQAVSVEAFDPPIFASLCSPNLRTALERLKTYKRLIGPMVMTVADTREGVSVTLECYGYDKPLPKSMTATEAVFLTQLGRIATRSQLVPLRVTLPDLPDPLSAYFPMLGTNIARGDRMEVVFSHDDAQRPFLTENVAMWEYFEPELKQRLSQLDSVATLTQRVKSVLLEMLPSGESSIEVLAERLAMSKRTLQRKLNQEGANYQDILKNTRQDLAQHYLKDSNLSPGEISFLLGFQDTNSFIRAYSGWTGHTPGEYRSAAL